MINVTNAGRGGTHLHPLRSHPMRVNRDCGWRNMMRSMEGVDSVFFWCSASRHRRALPLLKRVGARSKPKP